MDLTNELVRYALKAKYEDLPPQVVKEGKWDHWMVYES